MRRNFQKIPPEILIAGSMVALLCLASALFSLPIITPSGERAQFVGVHYIYPLVGVAILGLITLLMGKRKISLEFLIALPCYIVILFVHFNMKLWIPHLNSMQFDDIYWKIDQNFYIFVEICIFLREKLFIFIPYEANFYMKSYMMLFYISFAYHALFTPQHFRRLIIATLLLQALGTIAYLIAPAVGPFLYEPGVDPIISEGQKTMLQFYRQSLAGGPDWLAQNGSADFIAGLAAMPSLHSAGAFLFFLFAYKYGKLLLPLYGFILAFILVTAVASRWHYLIDLPVGMAIAWISYTLSNRLVAPRPDVLHAQPVPQQWVNA